MLFVKVDADFKVLKFLFDNCNVSSNITVERISRSTSLSSSKVSKVLDVLFTNGFILRNNRLTDKGFRWYRSYSELIYLSNK